MRLVWILFGLLAVVAGAVMTLQGLDVIGGSPMSGQSTWAIVGPLVAVVGAGGFVFGLRRTPS